MKPPNSILPVFCKLLRITRKTEIAAPIQKNCVGFSIANMPECNGLMICPNMGSKKFDTTKIKMVVGKNIGKRNTGMIKQTSPNIGDSTRAAKSLRQPTKKAKPHKNNKYTDDKPCVRFVLSRKRKIPDSTKSRRNKLILKGPCDRDGYICLRFALRKIDSKDRQ